VEGARTLVGYQARLQLLLDGAAAALSVEEIDRLRMIVCRRRNGRPSLDALHAAPQVCECADEIVALLGAASRELRPRETQELDDLVAGRLPKNDPPPSSPVRMHRRGRG
jgi:hypothetical protein